MIISRRLPSKRRALSYGVLSSWPALNCHQIFGHQEKKIQRKIKLTGVRVILTHFCKSLSPEGEREFSRLLFRFSPRSRSLPLFALLLNILRYSTFIVLNYFGNISVMGHVFLFPKAGKIGSGTDKRREGEGFDPGTEKDLNENTQKETQADEIPGI